MDENESISKKDTICFAIEKTNSIKPVLVGDSSYDYDEAKCAGVDFIGALYGFGLKY